MGFSGIKEVIGSYPADILFVQEIDIKSKRSFHINQVEALKDFTGKGRTFAYNYNCIFVCVFLNIYFYLAACNLS